MTCSEDAAHAVEHEHQKALLLKAKEAAVKARLELRQEADSIKDDAATKLHVAGIEERAVLQLPFSEKKSTLLQVAASQQQARLEQESCCLELN